jgi:tetratricopeptide (TPR) repeat protein
MARVPGGGRARDEKGRWVRRADSGSQRCAAAEFVFDDRVLEGTAPPASGERPFRMDGEDAPPAVEPATDVWGGVWPAADEPAPPQRANAARLPSAFWLLGAVLAAGAVLLAAAQSRLVTHGQLSRWLSRSGSATASEAPLTVPGDAGSSAGSPATRLDRVVIPPVPPPIALRTRPAVGAGTRSARLADAAARPAGPAPAPAAPQPHADADADASAAAEPGSAAGPPVVASIGTEEEDGWFRLAEEYALVGDGKRAEELLRRIHDHGRQRGRAALALGDLLAARGDFERASEFYRESTQLFQDGTEPLTAR